MPQCHSHRILGEQSSFSISRLKRRYLRCIHQVFNGYYGSAVNRIYNTTRCRTPFTRGHPLSRNFFPSVSADICTTSSNRFSARFVHPGIAISTTRVELPGECLINCLRGGAICGINLVAAFLPKWHRGAGTRTIMVQ